MVKISCIAGRSDTRIEIDQIALQFAHRSGPAPPFCAERNPSAPPAVVNAIDASLQRLGIDSTHPFSVERSMSIVIRTAERSGIFAVTCWNETPLP